MTKAKVYIETSVISYLTAKPSRDIIVSACQQITRDWWEMSREHFDLYVSAWVITEAAQGDPEAARKRLDSLAGINILAVDEEAKGLAGMLMTELSLPRNAAEDALHIAAAVVSGMDYLLSWNCRHIAHARIAHDVMLYVQSLGYPGTVLCTPQTLMEEYDE